MSYSVRTLMNKIETAIECDIFTNEKEIEEHITKVLLSNAKYKEDVNSLVQTHKEKDNLLKKGEELFTCLVHAESMYDIIDVNYHTSILDDIIDLIFDIICLDTKTVKLIKDHSFQKNLCVWCDTDLGPQNPRQYCDKTSCFYEEHHLCIVCCKTLEDLDNKRCKQCSKIKKRRL